MLRYNTTLPSGLRIVMEHSTSRAVYCGIVVCAGTRHEDAADSGMAHFVEHLSFKGTQRRTARQITGLLERRGGDVSAYTSKQETVYYAQVMPEDFALAADLLCDMVFCSTFPQAEINKEVEVICDEIESYRDAPAELIFDDFESRLFPDHPLGRDVLGEPERLRQYTTADALRFTNAYYRPNNCVFYVYGDIDFEKTERAIAKAMNLCGTQATAAGISSNPNPSLVQSSPCVFKEEVHKSTHQAHVVVGSPTFGVSDPRHATLQLLNSILGGPAPNSRFNLALRERTGLVYTVDSYASLYPDAGMWVTYFGCDTADVSRCLRLLHREISHLTDHPLSERTLQAAKRQFIRQTRLACDNHEGYALALGKTFAHYGRHRDVEQFCAKIDAVTPNNLLEVARQLIATERLSTLIYR